MNPFALLSAVALLAAGCAGRTAPQTATPVRPVAPAAPASTSAARTSQVVELRHFYLLAPGPDAKLVVTSSDVTSSDRSH